MYMNDRTHTHTNVSMCAFTAAHQAILQSRTHIHTKQILEKKVSFARINQKKSQMWTNFGTQNSLKIQCFILD